MLYVTYLRVSTDKQGESGLGLEAQRATVNSFVKPADSILAEFVEVESGAVDNRPVLAQAVDLCKRKGATILVAKMDRLSRETSYIMSFAVPFVTVETPDLNTLTKGIYATISQHERELISRRTKDALAAKKARGEKLGTPANLTDEARAKGVAAIKANAAANKANMQAKLMIDLLGGQGLTLQQIADKLNVSGFRTRRGSLFTPTAVRRLQGA